MSALSVDRQAVHVGAHQNEGSVTVSQDPLDTGPTDAAGQLDAGRLELCSQSGGGLGKARQRVTAPSLDRSGAV